MIKQTIYKDMQLGDRFNVAFPDERIPNGFIDKSKTRIGITYTNFHDKRNSITVIPSEPIIEEALTKYPYLNLFDVRGKITSKEVVEYLKRPGDQYKRVVTTPDGFWKIMEAFTKMKQLNRCYKDFFLYLDEVHSYATDAFRVTDKNLGILTPFDPKYNHVWKFSNMAMGSATPFEFSDPRILALQRYKLRYKESFGCITLVNDAHPIAALQYMLKNPAMFPGNVHIFFNTVTEIGAVIQVTGITDVNIYCRYEERNMANLEEACQYYKHKPLKRGYAKFNFYSCRYNDGWDLEDDETATLILVTDVKIPHSLIGIPYKGFQAVGRMQVQPNKIYHITNNRGRMGMRSLESIRQKWLYNAGAHIAMYNKHLANCQVDGIENSGFLRNAVKPFSHFMYSKAELFYMKLDQIICEEYCREHYNSIKSIRETWESLNYNVVQCQFDLAPVDKTRKSKAEVNRSVIERYEHLKRHPENYVYEVASATMKKYQTKFNLLFEAHLILGPAELRKLGYEDKAMKEGLIKRSNNIAEHKLRRLLIDTFKLKDTKGDIYANRYTNKKIKAILQGFYDELEIKKPNGGRRIAKAEELKEFGLFQLELCKVVDDDGVRRHGFEVVKELYSLTNAA